jgi:hypothetical protein
MEVSSLHDRLVCVQDPLRPDLSMMGQHISGIGLVFELYDEVIFPVRLQNCIVEIYCHEEQKHVMMEQMQIVQMDVTMYVNLQQMVHVVI